MAAAKQLVFFLYILMLVSIAVCVDVFKLVSSSVQLDLQKNFDKSLELIWKFNGSKNIVKYDGKSPSRRFGSYKDRVEFNEETQNLTLKNLQKNDSGPYKADAIDENDITVATYQLYVLDPVKKPVLNVSPQQSNDSCNVTLTCGAQKLSITSHCYNANCDMKEEKTAGDVFLFLYVSNSFIICNHSNPASWKNTTMEMEEVKQFCPSKENNQHSGPVKLNVPALIIGIITICIFIGLIFGIWRYKKSRTMDFGNTVYEEVKGENKSPSVEMSENPEPPGTVYCTVGKPAQDYSNDESTVSTANPGTKEMDPSDSNLYDTPDKNQGAGGNYVAVEVTHPQTIYATVNKPGKRV
ncbi:SLAM family member 7-like [Pangasianodon hypophthalmus]|uniref:SLAM family member 7-like n=1 Tax=Pangasianodon hypophthalmus TaxID=310915 RepID=UPI00230721CF|nr:SLAM family member 7-like [Pangasianodon hypophthalmus]